MTRLQENPHRKSSTTPWGSWEVLDDSTNFKVKKIIVKAGQRLSYQKHFKRSETWFIVEGEAEVTLDEKLYQLKSGESIHIKVEAAHRVKNPAAKADLIFIEIQEGSYFGEDDIVRLSDDYGRSAEKL